MNKQGLEVSHNEIYPRYETWNQDTSRNNNSTSRKGAKRSMLTQILKDFKKSKLGEKMLGRQYERSSQGIDMHYGKDTILSPIYPDEINWPKSDVSFRYEASSMNRWGENTKHTHEEYTPTSEGLGRYVTEGQYEEEDSGKLESEL